MKKILVITLLLVPLLFQAQEDSTKISFVSYWSIGDSYDFKITKSEERWKGDKEIKNEVNEYVANFEVIDSTATSYTIKWTYETDLQSSYDIPDNLMDRLSKYKLTEIRYKTTELGEFIEIINWKEVGKIMNEMMDDIVDVLGENDKEMKKILARSMKTFKKIFSSKEGIEQLVLDELQYFHFPFGREYDITEPILYEDELPNMLGGAPIKANAKLYFENVDFEDSFCVMKQELKLDPVDTKRVLEEVFKEMNLPEKDLEKAMENAIFDISNQNVFEYYYYPGVPHKIEVERKTVIDIDEEKGKRIDRTLIELIYQE